MNRLLVVSNQNLWITTEWINRVPDKIKWCRGKCSWIELKNCENCVLINAVVKVVSVYCNLIISSRGSDLKEDFSFVNNVFFCSCWWDSTFGGHPCIWVLSQKWLVNFGEGIDFNTDAGRDVATSNPVRIKKNTDMFLYNDSFDEDLLRYGILNTSFECLLHCSIHYHQ